MARYIAGFRQEARKYGRFFGRFGPFKPLARGGSGEDYPPPVFAKGGANFLLLAQPDHQTKSFFDCLFFTCAAQSLLGVRH
jgi:hypothetical protein